MSDNCDWNGELYLLSMDLIWQGHGERLLKESRSAHAQASRRPVTGQPLGPRERSLSRLLSGEWRTPQAPEARLANSDSPPRVRTLSPPRESRSAALPLSLSPSKESMRRLSWRGDVPPRVPYTSHAVHRERQSVVQLVRSGLGLLVGPPLATPTHLGWRAPGLPRSHTLRTKWGATEPRSYPLALRGCAAMPNVHQSRRFCTMRMQVADGAHSIAVQKSMTRRTLLATPDGTLHRPKYIVHRDVERLPSAFHAHRW